MIKEIMAEFRATRTPMCVDELSKTLEIEASALEGILDTLVQRGRLHVIDPTNNTCVACPAKGGCVILTNGLQKSYTVRG
ncbi:MAG: hypothetical protein KDJ52_18505 [Anaerolineae bacterium]|nr:hypothetical protein [Anaerolineae bacterium]